MSFPDIPLEAINKAASQLFARKDSVTEDEALGLRQSLLDKIGELDRAITSIEGQLATRKDDPEWAASAQRARRGYARQRDSIKQFLGTVNVILNNLNAHNARVARTTRHKETILLQQTEGHKKKVERIAAANTDAQRFLTAFKRVCKESLGEDRYMELVAETKRRLAAEEGQPATTSPRASGDGLDEAASSQAKPSASDTPAGPAPKPAFRGSLQVWNGRAFCCRKPSDPRWASARDNGSFSAYICAYSRADAARVVAEYTGGQPPSDTELKNYFSPHWGTPMEGIARERGLWLQFDRSAKPVRVWPAES